MMKDTRSTIADTLLARRQDILIKGSHHMWYIAFAAVVTDMLKVSDTLTADGIKGALKAQSEKSDSLLAADCAEAIAMIDMALAEQPKR
jgi:uncharacterized protein (DUF427 family)